MGTKVKKSTNKKEKKLIKLIDKPEDEESEHELSYYMDDRVKLMKEVLKIIKPARIKSMAPQQLKNRSINEINSMLLEELLGISNKRLKYIFNGQNLEEDSSSSTDPEEVKPIDIISLDDVSDDDFVEIVENTNSKRIKKEKKIKKEKPEKKKKKSEEANLMSVLELLELQARARAIRSQLALENKAKEAEKVAEVIDDDDNEPVIIQSPKNDEIVISSESEGEETDKNKNKEGETSRTEDKVEEEAQQNGEKETPHEENTESLTKNNDLSSIPLPEPPRESTNNEDGLLINVDQSEIDCIINE